MLKNILIVGAGISGLSAAAFLSKEGHQVTLLEKDESLGGLIGSFQRNGFLYDQGIRGVENSGTLFPMLKSLGIHIDFLPNVIDMGIAQDVISITPHENYGSYKTLLFKQYPNQKEAIEAIFKDIKKISKYMKVLYDIDNPLFLDPKTDTKYLIKTIVPWMFQYTFTIGKIEKLKQPIRQYLLKYTQDEHLIDAIAQHFFTDTPAFFALSYLKMHSDYYYPKGGTGSIVKALEKFILDHGGVIQAKQEITRIDVNENVAYTKDQKVYRYDALLWCGDLNSMYRSIENTKIDYAQTKTQLEKAVGNDSLYQMYIALDLDKSFFSEKFSGHLFYMPQKEGLSSMDLSAKMLIEQLNQLNLSNQKALLESWLITFSKHTTYEISVPVVRDDTLAPKGKSAVILSTLFDYDLTKYLSEKNLYNDLKVILSKAIIDTLESTLLKGWKNHIIHAFEATPLTIESRLNNTGGAITGWSFSNKTPVEDRLFKIANSIKTPFPNIFQSSQWSFSPSGFPTSIVTAKIAANKIHKMKMK
jgi:phytoene dehydrogenase-like protein